jgi:phosphatidylglycerol:prolipoprotein diacylglycerol transferase
MEDFMLKNITVAFPGLGIDGGEVNSVAFTLGENFSVMWYGVVIALGMLMAIAYASFRCKQQGIKIDDLIDIAIFTIFFGVIGARLYYVIFNPTNFKTIMDVLDIRSGGLAIYGGVIAGALTIVIVCLIKKISWRKLFDAAGPGVMIAQAMGRWGNFFNGEAYGSIVEEGHPLYFLRMGLISNNTWHDFGTSQMVYVHPCFLYESLWNVIGFILINIFFKKKKFDGQIALYYFAWYGFGRMFIEGLRTDALYIGQTGIRVSQLLAFLLFAVASALIVLGLVYVKNHPDSKLAIANNTPVVEEKRAETEKENG